MATPKYHGFSSQQYLSTKQTMALTDVDLVKRDLLNHIFTRRGERLMMPNFGTTIPDLLFEPIDDATVDEVRNQLSMVFNYDPRVSLLSMSVIPVPDLNGIIASAVLQYLELDTVDRFDLHIEFNSQ